jgi:putative chitinase
VIPLTLDILRRALPRANETNAALHLASLNEGMARWQITTPARIAAFLAQVGHESGDLARTEENLNYRKETLVRVWPSRFKTLEQAAAYEHQPEKLANHVYAGRMGNGHEASGDGFRYRGRGLIQLTGRATYATFAPWALETPDWLAEAPEAARSACWYWGTRNLNALADAGDHVGICRAINGGRTGLADRQARLAVAQAALQEGLA